MKTKNILTIIIVALIVIAIGYLESKKPASVGGGGQEIILNDEATASSTLSATSSTSTVSTRASLRVQKAKQYSRAKELSDPTGFINTGPFKLSDIIGKKVVLIDFWTYSCINCLRTLPYLRAWYDKYKDDGLVIVGVHTPEFDFEKDYANVSDAVKRLGIKYPVVLDSNHGTWNAYQNSYWPREYLIDIDGFIVHDKIGEGDYDGTERAIQKALEERNTALGIDKTIDKTISKPVDVIPMNNLKVGSPETYFGSDRNQYLGNGTRGAAGTQTFTVPAAPSPNILYLGGTWNFTPEYAENTAAGAKIIYKYNSKNVYIVASSKSGVDLKILLDGAEVKTIHVQDNRLYDIINGSDYGVHTLEIEVEGAGLDAFTFTFG